MEYLQIYKEQFDKTWLEIKNQTIKELKLEKRNKDYSFIDAYNRIRDSLNEQRKMIIKQFEIDGVINVLEMFKNSLAKRDEKQDKDEIIEFALTNKVKQEYEKTNKKDYASFIIKMSKHESLMQFHNHLTNYDEYYKLIFNLDKYEYFYGKKIENSGYQNSKQYKEMAKLEYDDSTPEIGIKDLQEKSHNNSKNIEDDITENNQNISRNSIQNEFSLKERAILIHLLKYRFKELKLTEIIKVILIIGATDQFEIFDAKGASGSYLYKQAQQGYSVFKSKELRSKISELRVKLKNHGLKEIEEELKIDFSNHLNKK